MSHQLFYTYTSTPFEAAEINRKNIHELATVCGGEVTEIETSEKRKVVRLVLPESHKDENRPFYGYLGDYLVKSFDGGWRIFKRRVFLKLYQEVWPDAEKTPEPEEAKEEYVKVEVAVPASSVGVVNGHRFPAYTQSQIDEIVEKIAEKSESGGYVIRKKALDELSNVAFLSLINAGWVCENGELLLKP